MLRRRTVLPVLAAGFGLFGCTDSEADMNKAKSTDMDKLAKLIVLDPQPRAARWSVHQLGTGEIGPSDYVLVALLEYDEAGYGAIANRIGSAPDPQGGYVQSLPAWVPAEFTAQARPLQEGGYDFTGRAMPAAPFTKSPYLNGFSVLFPEKRAILIGLFTS